MIEVRNLTKAFLQKNGEELYAVKDLSFTARKGEIVVLLGVNGAGKTTTMRMLSTVLKPNSGTAEVEGFDAVAGACFTDSGIMSARSLMDIPVVGAAESSFYLARLMGNCFTIITTNPQNLPGIEQQIKEFEMKSFFLTNQPVRFLDNKESFWPDLLRGDHKSIIDVFMKAAKKSIEDRADVIIVVKLKI